MAAKTVMLHKSLAMSNLILCPRKKNDPRYDGICDRESLRGPSSVFVSAQTIPVP